MIDKKDKKSDYRFFDATEVVYLILFVFAIFVYEAYEGFSWATENQVTDTTACEQQFSTQQPLRWFRYFTKMGCKFYIERAENVNADDSYQVDE